MALTESSTEPVGWHPRDAKASEPQFVDEEEENKMGD